MKTPREKYEQDDGFHALVNMMIGYIFNCDYTPSEMRQAAVLASIKYGELHVRDTTIPIPENIEKSLDMLHTWINREKP